MKKHAPRAIPDQGFMYIDLECCRGCGLPPELAPDVFAAGRDTCYVRRQPRTVTELRQVLRVFRSQELDCVRYAGRDPRVIRILRRAGQGDKVDEGGLPRSPGGGQGISYGDEDSDVRHVLPRPWWSRLFGK
jgi:hypothetical protein